MTDNSLIPPHLPPRSFANRTCLRSPLHLEVPFAQTAFSLFPPRKEEKRKSYSPLPTYAVGQLSNHVYLLWHSTSRLQRRAYYTRVILLFWLKKKIPLCFNYYFLNKAAGRWIIPSRHVVHLNRNLLYYHVRAYKPYNTAFYVLQKFATAIDLA